MTIEERLEQAKLVLPDPPKAVGNYKPWVKVDNLIFVSGQFPIMDGVLRYKGKLGANLTVEEGYEAAKLCALNSLAQLKAALGSLEHLQVIARVDGHVNSAPGWTQQAAVLNGASDLFAEIMTDKAGHARTAFGHSELPLNAAVELVLIAVIKSEIH
ncbi:RidA family protein [Nostoc sp. LEGE 12450]|uniref:RidA family protein n=1 Tax=Nostoc sp. LEGE 12450 TaxID=1828643 RepID=UPI0018812900|nr:RidA family protein [Nostoc sp. LEGE 12450]MBE8987809.1 RidA family protein [Nostoc sp. LEGE 12450]